MPQRYELDEPIAWVEFGDSWTRGEVLHFADLEGAEFFAFIGRKLAACHLPMGDGSVLDDPALFVEKLDDIDVRAFYWLMSLPALEYGRVGRLGESTGRQWLESYVKTKLTTEPLTAQQPS